MTVVGGSFRSGAVLLGVDEDHDLALLKVPLSPFQRDMHAFAKAEGAKTGVVEMTSEKYWVPILDREMPSTGREVLLVGVSLGDAGLSSECGRVTRLGVDFETKGGPLRIYTSLPYQELYCGAPVAIDSKHVVGMAHRPEGRGQFDCQRMIRSAKMFSERSAHVARPPCMAMLKRGRTGAAGRDSQANPGQKRRRTREPELYLGGGTHASDRRAARHNVRKRPVGAANHKVGSSTLSRRTSISYVQAKPSRNSVTYAISRPKPKLIIVPMMMYSASIRW